MLESIVFAGTAVRCLQRDSLIVGIEAWYWFPKGREEQTCHGELVSLWAFPLQRPLVLFQCLHIKKLKKTLAGRHPRLQQVLRIHIRAPSCQRIESICKTWLWRVGCSMLHLESWLHMDKASDIVNSSWLLAESMGLYRGVKVIATFS